MDTINIAPKDLYDELLEDTKKHNDAANDFLNSLTFYGKSLTEHSADFYIEVPKDISPDSFRTVLLSLMEKVQLAQHYYAIASSIASALANTTVKKKADVVAAIVAEFERKKMKRPGQDVISSMADSYLGSTTNVYTSAKIIKDFWKNKLDALIEMRKCMEQIGISRASEMKHLN